MNGRPGSGKEGLPPSRPKAEPQTKRPAFARERGEGGRKDAGPAPRRVRDLQPPNTRLSRNIITSPCATLKTQTVLFPHGLPAHTELIAHSRVFPQQEESRRNLYLRNALFLQKSASSLPWCLAGFGQIRAENKITERDLPGKESVVYYLSPFNQLRQTQR